MNMKDWAIREIELTCKNGVDEYTKSCMGSALKAYSSLLEDGHSGASVSITKSILDRLIEGKPLSPIVDEDFFAYPSNIHSDKEFLEDRGLKSDIQCGRMTSLFRQETLDGEISYTDVDRVIGYEIGNDIPFRSGLTRYIVDILEPITMPYYPEERPYKVYIREFLFDDNNGDFDTVGISYMIKPNGERVDINRYFKEGENNWEEIDSKEYLNRMKEMAVRE